MRIHLTKVRLSFPDIFEAVQYQGKGAFRYNATFLVEPGSKNDKAIEEAILAAATEAFAGKAGSVLKATRGNVNKFCYLEGDTKEYDGYAGMKYLAAHRQQKAGPPTVKDTDGKTSLGPADGKPYAGCYVNAIVDIYGQTGENVGIRANLLGIQFHSDGDAFSAGKLADDAFTPVEGSDTDGDI